LISRTLWLLVMALTTGVLAVSCSGLDPLPMLRASTATPLRPTATPTAAIGPASGFTERVNLDEIAPPGPGRDLVIMNCDYCHSWVCTVRGQRTLDHWVMVEDVHLGRGWVILPDQEWNTLFNYLEKNFNDQKPEPVLPPIFALAGCTHSTFR
jgi:hypothetical protein